MVKICSSATALLLVSTGLAGLTLLAQQREAEPGIESRPLEQVLQPVPPKEPEEALKTFETLDGFRMELVAAEPLVYDPVSAAFDENGRLYVTEMRDYPHPPSEGRPSTGRVRLLEDSDENGVFDKSTVFADELLWPTGVTPWKGGVFVASPPDIWYFKDTDGDSRADLKERVLTGFSTKNEQGGVNSLIWGLDNKIYGSASVNGGEIYKAGDPDPKPQSLSGSDFRFDPRTGDFEIISGRGQFGNTFDDWGNRFLCTQSRPTYHELLPRQYLARNPYLTFPKPVLNLVPTETPIFRTSGIKGWRAIRSQRRIQADERPATSSGASHDVLDSVGGVTVYRGDAYPDKYRGNLFVGESLHNLIHRRLLIPDGVTFKSVRADEGTEFVTSTDDWFRPVNFVNSPDGTLLVLDMYREMIESIHVPIDVAERVDMTSGRDYGRIYRLTPSGFVVPPPPRLGRKTSEELVAYLQHRNAWWRETAQRLLYERQDQSVTRRVRRLLKQSSLPQGRLHALWVLHGLEALQEEDLLLALRDESAVSREHAARLAEPRLNDSSALLDNVLPLANDSEDRVRFQVAFTLGEVDDPRAVAGLARIAARDAADEWMRSAVLSSSNGRADGLVAEILARLSLLNKRDVTELLEPLARVVGARNRDPELHRVVEVLIAKDSPHHVALRKVLLGLADGLRSAESSLDGLFHYSPPFRKLAGETIAQAKNLALDPKAEVGEREESIRLLAHGELADVLESLTSLLDVRQPTDVQSAAVRSLGAFENAYVPAILMTSFETHTPALRAEIIETLMAREIWVRALLDAVASEKVPRNLLTRAQGESLMNHPNDQLRASALKLLGDESSPRKEVLARYRPSLGLNGDTRRGETVFEANCMACHRVGDKGYPVGPNLVTARNLSPEALLVYILDPNRRQSPEYIQYVVVENNGSVSTGPVVSETATSLTLGREQTTEQTILKSNIRSIISTGKSMMPEGFEKLIGLQQMADLIAFLAESHYDIGTLPGRRAQ